MGGEGLHHSCWEMDAAAPEPTGDIRLPDQLGYSRQMNISGAIAVHIPLCQLQPHHMSRRPIILDSP